MNMDNSFDITFENLLGGVNHQDDLEYALSLNRNNLNIDKLKSVNPSNIKSDNTPKYVISPPNITDNKTISQNNDNIIGEGNNNNLYWIIIIVIVIIILIIIIFIVIKKYYIKKPPIRIDESAFKKNTNLNSDESYA